MTRSTITFVGPLTPSTRRADRAAPWHFHVLQGVAAEPFKLEYQSQDEARSARRTLTANPNTFSVPTMKLLTGIRDGMGAAYSSGVLEKEAA